MSARLRVLRVLGEARDSAATGVARTGLGLRMRAAIIGGMALAVVASLGAGGSPPWIMPALFVAGALVVAVRPDTHVGLGLLIAFGWYWLARADGDGGPSAWVLLAATGLTLFHLATSAAALGPADVDLPPALLTTWARRAVPILGGTLVLWLVTALLGRADLPANVVLTAAALVVVAAGAWLTFAHSQPGGTDEPTDERAHQRRTP